MEPKQEHTGPEACVRECAVCDRPIPRGGDICRECGSVMLGVWRAETCRNARWAVTR